MKSIIYTFFIILFLNLSCNAIQTSKISFITSFEQEWEKFLKNKDIDFYRIKTHLNQGYEFSLLREFSANQANRYRPYLEFIDRYESCRPYQENKITLLDGTEISASKIEFTSKYQKFIAAQAPSPPNIHLFWQMVIENQINQIVMLTELFEKHNPTRELAHAYWPQQLGEKLTLENGVKLTLLEEKTLLSGLEEFIQIRTLNLNYFGKERVITHYWYRNWKDCQAPSQLQTILQLIHKVAKDKNKDYSKSPILVHCSAGVGRTGVFIALSHLAQRVKLKDKKIDLFDFIAYLHWQRPHLVGTLPQYTFCYEAWNYLQHALQ